MRYVKSASDWVIACIALFLAFGIGAGFMSCSQAVDYLQPLPALPTPQIVYRIVYVPNAAVHALAASKCTNHGGLSGVTFWELVPTQFHAICNDLYVITSDGVVVVAGQEKQQ